MTESNEIIAPIGLTKRQLLALPHILASPSYEEAAKRADMCPKQIYEWLKEPTFLAELKKQRNAVFCDALAFLKTGVQKACLTLIALLDNEDPRIRLVASEKIIANAFKSNEMLDLEERIKALENLSEKRSQKGLSVIRS